EPYADDFVADGHRAVPGAVERHEEIAAVLRRELRARVEGEPERRGVGLVEEARPPRRLAAVAPAEVRIGDRACRRPVTVRPAVEAALVDPGDVLGGAVVAEPVAAVDGRPELGRSRPECDPDRIPEPGPERRA